MSCSIQQQTASFSANKSEWRNYNLLFLFQIDSYQEPWASHSQNAMKSRVHKRLQRKKWSRRTKFANQLRLTRAVNYWLLDVALAPYPLIHLINARQNNQQKTQLQANLLLILLSSDGSTVASSNSRSTRSKESMINQFNSSIARTNAMTVDAQVQIIVSETTSKIFLKMNEVLRSLQVLESGDEVLFYLWVTINNHFTSLCNCMPSTASIHLLSDPIVSAIEAM